MSEYRKTTIGAACALVLLGGCSSTTSSTTSNTKPPADTSTSTSAAATTATTTTSAATTSSTSTPTPAGPPSGVPASVWTEFLPQSSLPDWPSYGWKKPDFNQVDVEHPLPDVCGTSLGPQVTHGVWEADYGSENSEITANEDIYTYPTAADAAAQMTASTPKCGGVTATTANGFAWSASGVTHVLYTRHDNKIATLEVTVGDKPYSPSVDTEVLNTMASRLADS